MRRSAGVVAVTGPDGSVVALLLRSAPCAEHEMPMGRLADALGIPGPTRDLAGLPSRTSTRDPGPGHAFHAAGTFVEGRSPGRKRPVSGKRPPRSGAVLAVTFDGTSRIEGAALDATLRDGACADPGFSADWGPDGFVLRGYGEGPETHVGDLWDAVARRDLAAWRVGPRFPFSDGGLALAVASAVPPDLAGDMVRSDADSFALRDSAAATGIADRLARARRHHVALRPAWVADVPARGEPPRTSHPVAFWLSPLDHDAAKSGWYTVEQLDEWVLGLGPVPIPGVDPDRPGSPAAMIRMFEAAVGRR